MLEFDFCLVYSCGFRWSNPVESSPVKSQAEGRVCLIRCCGFRWSNTEVLSPKKGQAEGSKKGNREEIKTPSTEDINALKRKIAKKRKMEALKKEEAELETELASGSAAGKKDVRRKTRRKARRNGK